MGMLGFAQREAEDTETRRSLCEIDTLGMQQCN